MNTLKIAADPLLSDSDLQTIISLLKRGSLVAIPTETVYGLAADLFCERAIQEIYSVKGRPRDNPLIAHVFDLDQALGLILDPPPLFFKLAEKFWPGPLTMVVRRRPGVAEYAAVRLPTIAVRMPKHPCIRQIISGLKAPLAAPSANLSGRPSATCADHAMEDFSGKIAAVVDGGNADCGIESTVVGLFGEKPVLLRPGAIGREELEIGIGMCLEEPLKTGPVLSPGMKYRHYAPKAKVHLVETKEAFEILLRSHSVYAAPSICSQNLYAQLRKADQLGFSEIAIYLDEKIQSNEALMNRLERAARG